jgi:uncharacterized protein
MAKAPMIGHTKTRLSPPLSLKQAAELYEALLLDTIYLGSSLEGIQLAIAITPPESLGYFKSISPDSTLFIPVEGAHIGDCLNQVINQLLAAGHPKVIACDADSPSLPEEYILQAFTKLDQHDAVVGPCEDGGYYFIGLKKTEPALFYDIDWSTSLVTEQTLALASKNQISICTTPSWYDIDNLADILRLKQELTKIPSKRLPNIRNFFLTQKHFPPTR